MLLLLLILLSFCYHYYYEFSICNNLFFWMKMANRFSGKSSFNKLSLLIGVPLKSIQVNEWNKKNKINRNICEKTTTTTTSTTKFWKWEQKTIKVGRTPIWGYLEFICYIIVWNIWKLKKFLLCAFGFANLDICWSWLMAVFILVCCTVFELFFWTTATTNLIRTFGWSSTLDFLCVTLTLKQDQVVLLQQKLDKSSNQLLA